MATTTADTTPSSVVVIDGNPQTSSRTARIGERLGDRLAAIAGTERVDVIALGDLGPGLLAWGDASVAAAKDQVLSSTLLVVATPTYKATYTGLLKLFLDQFDHGALRDVRSVVPLMTGGGPAHSLAVDVHLRPVLVEIGARIPTSGVYVWGDQIDDPEPVLDAWFATEGDVIRRQLA